MLKLSREKSIALGGLLAFLLACIAAPVVSLKVRADAVDALSDKRDMLDRLEAAYRRKMGKGGAVARRNRAPSDAFLNAQTQGLASAQLEAYLSKLILNQHGNLVSSGVQPADRAAADSVRVQATLDIDYDVLQRFLYEVETGTPYVFIDSMDMRPKTVSAFSTALSPKMRVTINLHGLWHQRTD
jgi:general secretion pathway protein M